MSEFPQPSTVPGWGDFVESLKTLPDRMLAKLPDTSRADPQIQQEVARLALEALASQATSAVGARRSFSLRSARFTTSASRTRIRSIAARRSRRAAATASGA